MAANARPSEAPRVDCSIGQSNCRLIPAPFAYLFLACAALNFGGAALFAPPCTALRAPMGLPEAPAAYLWILALWILISGLGNLDIARKRRFEPK